MEHKCEPCKYSTKHKHHLNRHLQTERHAKATSSPSFNVKTYSCSGCSRNFKTRAGMWKHKKCCKDTPTIWKQVIEENKDIIEAQRLFIKQVIEFIVLRINLHDNGEYVNEIVRKVNAMGLQYKIGVTE